jgi:acyl-CoA synthetase
LAEFRADGLTWTDDRLWPQFATHAGADPNALALIDCDDRRWTRRQLYVLALDIAERLAAAGVTAGSRVLAAGVKRVETLATALATSACEATFCP